MYNKIDIDDVLITGQHQAFFGHITGHGGPAATSGTAKSNGNFIGDFDVGLDHLANWTWRPVMQTWAGLFDVFTEKQFTALIAGVDTVEPRGNPDNDGKNGDYKDAFAGPHAAGHHAFEFFLPLT